MALEKKRQYKNIDVAYWKISGINISYTGKMVQIYVVGFSNSESRQEGINNKITRESYICKGKDFDTYFSITALNSLEANPVNAAYKYLKEKEKIFVDSVDV